MTEAIDIAAVLGRALHQAAIVLVASDPMEALHLAMQCRVRHWIDIAAHTPTADPKQLMVPAGKTFAVGGHNHD